MEKTKQNHIKYTDEMAAELLKAITGKSATDAVSGLEKLAESNGTFDVVISTDDIDRHGEIVRQSGLNTESFMKNPVVLFGHNSWGLPIGVCTEISKEERDGKMVTRAKGVFASHAQAQGQRELYDMGVAATSIGFIEKEREGNMITESELLEFSFVPIPANPHVHAIREAGLDIAELAAKGLLVADLKTGDDVAVNQDDDKENDDAILDNENDDNADDAENADDAAADENIDSESDDEESDTEPTDVEKILSAIGGIDSRLSALENSKNSDTADVAGSDSEGGDDNDSADDSDDSSDEPTDDETDDAVKFLRNRRKAQKAAKLINEVLADMAVDAKKHY